MISFDIPNAVNCVLERLEGAGHEAYLVGGCVRDMLLKGTPKDFDLATSAAPHTVAELFCDCKVIPTGIKHGTVTVIYEGCRTEITTFRRDGAYTDHRHPDGVVFSNSIEEDTARRDFTVNAMCYSPKRGLLDFHGGEKDLESGVIRCVGVAENRFEEDALRILRALRFAARLGFTIEPLTASSMLKKAHLLKNIAAERVLAEMNGFFTADGCAKLCIEFLDVFKPLFCEPKADAETFNVLNRQKPHFRLAAFFALYGGREGALPLIKSLKPDSKTVFSVCAAADAAYNGVLLTKESIAGAVCKYGAALYGDMLLFARSLNTDVCDKAEDILALLQNKKLPCSVRELEVSGNDLIALGLQKGRNIGKVLEKLFFQVYCGLPNEKEALIRAAID